MSAPEPKPTMDHEASSGAARWLATAINARTEELAGVLLAASCVFCMFSA